MLHDRQRRHGLPTLEQFERVVGQPDVAHLAHGHQLGHGTDRLLDRYRRIRVVELQHIHPIRAQPHEALVEIGPDGG